MLRSKPTFSIDDQGFGRLIVAHLTDVDRVVREHEVGIHDLGVRRSEGQVSGQLVSVDIASV